MNRVAIRRVRSILILLLDIVGIIVIFPSLYYLRLQQQPDFLAPELWLISGTIIMTLFLSGTYFRSRSREFPKLPINTFFKVLVAIIPCIVLVYLLGPEKFKAYLGRGILPIGMVLFGIWATLNRFFFNRLYHWQEQNTDLLYLGFSSTGEQFLQELKNNRELRNVHIVHDGDIESPIPELTRQYSQDDLGIFDKMSWQEVIVDPQHHASKVEAEKLVHIRLAGTPVHALSDYYEKHWYKIPVNQIGDDWFLRSQGFSMISSPLSHRLKRVIDIVLALILLVLTLPIVLLAAIAIKATSAGTIFFQQTRVGLQGQNFTIYKLRTMQQDAEKDGVQWAQTNDPRITKVGSFLRSSRIDELPQCWNVLKGDMSFVGPRPERPEFTQKLVQDIPYYDLRHLVKPGLSGWAQVMFPYGASTNDALRKLEYELYYIKNQSFLLDLNIMIRTFMVMFQRLGR